MERNPPVGETGKGVIHMTTKVQGKTLGTSAAVDTRLTSILTVLVFGIGLLFAAGYAQATVLHDAAHDQRHAMAFPCH